MFGFRVVSNSSQDIWTDKPCITVQLRIMQVSFIGSELIDWMMNNLDMQDRGLSSNIEQVDLVFRPRTDHAETFINHLLTTL